MLGRLCGLLPGCEQVRDLVVVAVVHQVRLARLGIAFSVRRCDKGTKSNGSAVVIMPVKGVFVYRGNGNGAYPQRFPERIVSVFVLCLAVARDSNYQSTYQ